MPFPTDRSMQSRFAGAIAKWLGISRADDLPPTDEVPYLSTFEFITGGAFSGRFKATLTVTRPEDNLITVSIGCFCAVIADLCACRYGFCNDGTVCCGMPD